MSELPIGAWSAVSFGDKSLITPTVRSGLPSDFDVSSHGTFSRPSYLQRASADTEGRQQDIRSELVELINVSRGTYLQHRDMNGITACTALSQIDELATNILRRIDGVTPVRLHPEALTGHE